VANSFDEIAGTLNGLFDFGSAHGPGSVGHAPNSGPFVLDPVTGQQR